MAEPGILSLPEGTVPEAHLAAHGLTGRAWSVGPGTYFPPHRHQLPKHLFVTRGSISFNGRLHQAPAGLLISAGFEHEAEAGEAGVDCVEAFEGEA